MAGYPGAPPFGGQYNNVSFGGPFPPNFAFNNMIPPPASSFGHQQPPFPPNQLPAPGQMPYGNAMAYQMNAQYHQQQHGQAQYPPRPAGPFYNAYGPYNNHNTYANNYNPNPFAEAAAAQQVQGGQVRGQLPQTWNAPLQDANRSASNQVENTQTNGTSQAAVMPALALQQVVPSPYTSNQLDGPISVNPTPENSNNQQMASSSNEPTPGQTPIQSESTVAMDTAIQKSTLVVNGTRKSSSTSDQSFDPYSGVASQTPGDTADTDRPTLSSPKNKPASTLPGLEPDTAVSNESELRITREQKRTLAIQAIQDLASRKIGYDQISKENFDLELLKGLYLESGVPLVLPTDVQPEVVKPAADSSANPSSSFSTKKAVAVSTDMPSVTAVPNFNLPIVSVTNPKSTKPLPQITTTDPVKKVATMTSDNQGSTPTSANPTRQDYLAKLQIAKEAVKNKANQPPTPTQGSDRSSYLAKLQAAKEAVKQSSTQKPSQPEIQATPQQNSNASSTLNEPSTAKTEHNSGLTRAQKDALLRQKLEALRKAQSFTASAALAQPSPSTASLSNKSQALQEQSLASVKSTLDVQESQLSTSNLDEAKDQEVSFFASSDMSGFQNLPGLPGLTSDPPLPAPASSNHQPVPDTAKLAQPAIIPTMSDEVPVQQKASETLQSRKRPVATDFNDSPPSKLLRISNSEPISRVIDISEDEGEISSDGHAGSSRSDAKATQEQAVHPNPLTRPEIPLRSGSYNASLQTPIPDLRAKEEAIRELRQRIAAATQRKNTKNISGTPSIGNSGTPLGSETEQVQRPENREVAINIGTQELTSQQKALAAAKLQAQKHLEQIRRNQASLNAHANKTQQDADNANSSAEREEKLRRKADLEARLLSIESVINTTEADLAQIKLEQDKLLSRIQQESQARSLLVNELKELLEGLEKEAPTKTTDVDVGIMEEEVPSTQPQENHAPLEIVQIEESGPEQQSDPSPPAMVTSAKQPIEISASSSNVTSRPNSPQRDEISSGDVAGSIDDDGEEQMDIDNDSIDTSEEEYDPGNIEMSYDNSVEPATHEASDEELEDYVDDYEPAQDIEVLPAASRIDIEPEHQEIPTSYQDATGLGESSAAASMSPPDCRYEREDVGEITKSASPERDVDITPETSEQTTSEAQPSSFAPKVDSLAEQGTNASQEDEHTDIPAERADDDVEEMAADTIPSLDQHFVPYKSPLAQFSSYRFHPQFTDNVAGGFHSLTYNHQINPNVEFCKWELAGGACNDANCDSQHFKDISLSDNNLLLQLGSIREGITQEERESYVSGLRNTISAMRARGLKDIDSIAREIVAYRRKFLKDPSRVVTNPDSL